MDDEISTAVISPTKGAISESNNPVPDPKSIILIFFEKETSFKMVCAIELTFWVLDCSLSYSFAFSAKKSLGFIIYAVNCIFLKILRCDF